MSPKATASLAILALALGAFIYFFERETVSTSEREARRGRVMETFVRDRVHRIELTRSSGGEEQRFIFERERDKEGVWRYFRLLEPIEAAADDDAVESLLAALDWAVPVSVLEDIEASELAQFGLEDPAIKVRVFTGSRSASLSVGKEAPTGIERYALGERDDQILIIPEDLVENLSHDLFHFRSKKLLPDGLAGLTKIERVHQGERLVMERDLSEIRIVEPIEMLANSARAERLLRSLETLSATTFLAEKKEEARAEHRRLFEEPALRFDLTIVGERVSVLIGGPCGDRESERIAVVGEGPVVCVKEADLDGLDLSLERLEERRLASARDYDVERFTLQLGERRLEVDLKDETIYRLFEGEKEIDRGEVDESSFTEWLRALRLAEATERLEVSAGELGRYGLENPRGELIIVERGPLKTTQRLLIGAERTAAFYAMRTASASKETSAQKAGARVVLAFPPDVAELLEPTTYRLRSRILLDAEAYRVRDIRVEGLGDGGEARELDPREHPTLTARLAELEAIEFVADKARSEFGLDEPALRLSFTIDAGHSHGHDHAHDHDHDLGLGAEAGGAYLLEIGARSGDAYYARLSKGSETDPHIFTVSAVLVESLSPNEP